MNEQNSKINRGSTVCCFHGVLMSLQLCFYPQGADVHLVYVSLCPFSSRSMYAPVTRLSLDTASFSIRSSAT